MRRRLITVFIFITAFLMVYKGFLNTSLAQEDMHEPVTGSEKTDISDNITTPMPVAAGYIPLEGDITISASSANTSFATYDTGDGRTPENLTITLTVTLTRSGIEGGYIVLPYGYFPTPETHPDFTMTEPFFEFIETDIASNTAGSIFSGIDTSAPDRLVLEIKNGLDATRQTVAVKFKLNDAYLNKIPNGSPLWNIKPEAYAGETLVNAPGSSLNIRSTSSFGVSASVSYFTPPDSVYTDGAITIRFSHSVTNASRCELDPDYEHIYYIEVSTGSVPDSNLLSFYGDGIRNMGNGYTRYIRKLTGSILTSATMDRSFTPPADIPVGTEFHFRVGYDYKLLNGIPAAGYKDCNYIKTDILNWNLYLATHHTSGSAYLPKVDITGEKTISTEGTVGWNTYIHNYTPKNLGASPVTGVRFILYQESEDSPKVAFDKITLCVSRDASKPEWSTYKVLYNIKNALVPSGASDRQYGSGTVYKPNAAGETQNITVNLPALTDGEYIDEVVVIPMGTDGNSEGVWPGKNGLGIRYHPTMWPGQVWPDGTFISDNTAVPLSAIIIYNKPMPEGGIESLEHRMSSYNTYYVATNTTAATATLYTTNTTGLAPGDTVQCEIRGFNNAYHGISVWENPRVVLRVPVQLELSGSADMDLIDNDGNVREGIVSVEKLPGSDAAYAYYAFQVMGYSAPLLAGDSVASFTIPVTFSVAAGAAPGNYSLNRVLVSNGKPETFRQIQSSANYRLNNLPAGENEADYGFSEAEFYSARTISTNFNIRSIGLLTSTTSIRGLGTDGLWSDALVVPAQKGETVEMRVVIENKGNIGYSDIRFYDILPREGDPLGSTGSVSFVGVENPHIASIRYSTVSPPTPTYGQHGNDEPDLQTYSFSSWTTTPPEHPTAVYIDLGAAQILPGESVEMIFKFLVPSDTGEQKAFNQFRYSGKETVTKNAFNFNSAVSGFSTQAIMLAYNENLPDFTIDEVLGMPEASTGTFGIGSNRMTVTADIPTLTGYTFGGWYDNKEGTGDEYTAENIVTFTSPGAVTLYAKWTPVKVRINFDKNGGDTEGSPNYCEVDFGTILAENDFPSINPAREGHFFGGWSTSSGENNSPDFTVGMLIASPDTRTAYAVWKEQPKPETPADKDNPDPSLDYPPGYEVIQTNDDTIVLKDADGNIIGQWIKEDDGWIYHGNNDVPQLKPDDNGSFEVIDPDGAPIGLWNKNEDDEWIYEEYPPANNINPWMAICGLAGLLAIIFFFIIARRRITRGEFVQLIVSAIDLDVEMENAEPYTDVSEDDKYYHAIMSAKTAGILSGFPDPEFEPASAITREEISSIIAGTVRYSNIPLTSETVDLSSLFNDFDKINESYLADIQLVVQLGIIQGNIDDRFGPEKLSTRRQAAKMVKNMLAVISPYLPSDTF